MIDSVCVCLRVRACVLYTRSHHFVVCLILEQEKFEKIVQGKTCAENVVRAIERFKRLRALHKQEAEKWGTLVDVR
jgi:hypothetical protein